MSWQPKSVFLTTSWDDGHPHDLRIAELLAKYGQRGTFYVPFRSQRPVLEVSAIKRIGASFDLGGHTMDHIDLTSLADSSARHQLTECKQRLEDLTGRSCLMFCPPCGRLKRSQQRLVRQAGYTGIRTVELMSTSYGSMRNGLAILPTTIQAFQHTSPAYLRNVARRLAFRSLPNLARAYRYGISWSATAARLLELALSQGGVFHLWGHSWEIDEANAWNELESILRLMAVCGRTATAISNAALCAVLRQDWRGPYETQTN